MGIKNLKEKTEENHLEDGFVEMFLGTIGLGLDATHEVSEAVDRINIWRYNTRYILVKFCNWTSKRLILTVIRENENQETRKKSYFPPDLSPTTWEGKYKKLKYVINRLAK